MITSEAEIIRHARAMGRAAARTNSTTDCLYEMWRAWCQARDIDVTEGWYEAVDAYHDTLDAAAN
jgi:L-rhamnose isomerase